MRYEKHIFICANQKLPGKTCCGETMGLELVNKFREVLKKKGLQGVVRAQRSGCIDACSNGPALVVYPEGVYYGPVKLSDVEKIVVQHIEQGLTIEELKIQF
jgi:(2Fe-2S) ferredoxin